MVVVKVRLAVTIKAIRVGPAIIFAPGRHTHTHTLTYTHSFIFLVHG